MRGRAGARRPGRLPLPQHAQHRLRQRGRRDRGRLRACSTPRVGGTGGCPFAPARDRQHRDRGPRLPPARHGPRDRHRPRRADRARRRGSASSSARSCPASSTRPGRSRRSRADGGDDAGSARARARARGPALVVVDLVNGFTDPDSPLYCDADDGGRGDRPAARRRARRGRAGRVHDGRVRRGGRAGRRARSSPRCPRCARSRPARRWPPIDARIAPRAGEPVLVKLFASAFFGTPLAAMLAAHGADTVVVTGASTSGCVRATVVDALQHGYRVVVPREAVADRQPGPARGGAVRHRREVRRRRRTRGGGGAAARVGVASRVCPDP